MDDTCPACGRQGCTVYVEVMKEVLTEAVVSEHKRQMTLKRSRAQKKGPRPKKQSPWRS